MSYHRRMAFIGSPMLREGHRKDTQYKVSIRELSHRARRLLYLCREAMARQDWNAWAVFSDEHNSIMNQLWERVQ